MVFLSTKLHSLGIYSAPRPTMKGFGVICSKLLPLLNGLVLSTPKFCNHHPKSKRTPPFQTITFLRRSKFWHREIWQCFTCFSELGQLTQPNWASWKPQPQKWGTQFWPFCPQLSATATVHCLGCCSGKAATRFPNHQPHAPHSEPKSLSHCLQTHSCSTAFFAAIPYLSSSAGHMVAGRRSSPRALKQRLQARWCRLHAAPKLLPNSVCGVLPLPHSSLARGHCVD